MPARTVVRVRAVVHPKLGECYAVSLREIAIHPRASQIMDRIRLATAASARAMDDDETSPNYATIFLGVNVLTLAAMLDVYGCEVKIDQSLCANMPSPKGTAPQPKRTTWRERYAAASDQHHDQRDSTDYYPYGTSGNPTGTTTHQRPQPHAPPANFFSRKAVADVDYHTLGVLPSAPFAVIRAAYRALAMEHHPDRGGKAEDLQRINVAFARIEKTRGGA